MVARVGAVHERDAVAGAIGESKSHRVRVETPRPRNIRREQQRVRQAARMHPRRLRPCRRRGRSARDGRGGRGDLRVRRNLWRDEHVHQHALGIAKPEPRCLGLRMRLDGPDPQSGEALPQRVEVLLPGAEREILQPLRARRLQHGPPAMGMPERVEVEAVVVPANLEAEVVVEARGHVEVGDRKDEMIERMDRDDAGAPCGCSPWFHASSSPAFCESIIACAYCANAGEPWAPAAAGLCPAASAVRTDRFGLARG